MPPTVGILKMPDSTTYYGQFNAREPHGVGCMYFPVGGYFAGAFADGVRHGAGVYAFPDGSRYEGEFERGDRDGYGVYLVPIGDRYRGQWRSSSQDGVGELLDWTGRLQRGIFASNAFVSPLPTTEDVLVHLQAATSAQRRAISAERAARESERTAYFQATMTIDGWYIQTADDLAAFEADAATRHEAAATAWQREYRALEAETQEGKTEEAALGEAQKQLHLTIQSRRAELARLSMFWDIVGDKEKHLAEATRVLSSVEAEIAAEEAWVAANRTPSVHTALESPASRHNSHQAAPV
ncbi:hypothetical protein ACHHYP_05019 [Achlya hypogyna]|uniref:Uncharacterized protein n=1 Tax=Achlya hypogyna TaxID=1202772 RepID=A0A1V9YZD2_ACHHY|nr:hypothetical protein ACHHYP_05019 [Achlya hypogyna]